MKREESLCNAQIIIPTLNAGEKARVLFDSIKMQKNAKIKILIIDSESTDKTIELAKKYGYNVKNIKRKDFNHGGTRRLGVDLSSDVEFIIFLTQDVVLVDEYSIRNILRCFKDQKVGCAYGRQIPYKDANILAAHARIFNYPAENKIKCTENIRDLGIKTAFISNSFAAYRRKALEDIGGFPGNVVLGEDIYVAAKMLLGGWKNYYCAEAKVYHSHNYTISEEYKRYYDIGFFYGQEKWIIESFGKTENEGMRFIKSQLKYVLRKKPVVLFNMCISNICKYIAYTQGLKYGCARKNE